MSNKPKSSDGAGLQSAVGPAAWFEVWVDEVSVFALQSDAERFRPHPVILFGNSQGNRFEAYEVVDNKTWFVVNTYAQAQDQLWEDGYSLVSGRETRD